MVSQAIGETLYSLDQWAGNEYKWYIKYENIFANFFFK